MEKKSIKMRRSVFFRWLIHRKTSQAITVWLRTEPRLNRNSQPDDDGNRIPNPYASVSKVQKLNCFINFDYEKSVNRQREREGKEPDFQAEQRTWGEHLTGSIVTHNQNEYVQLKVEKVLGKSYIADGHVVTNEEVERFITPKKTSDNQGVDRQVTVIAPKLTSIIEVLMMGIVIDMVDDDYRGEDDTTIEQLERYL